MAKIPTESKTVSRGFYYTINSKYYDFIIKTSNGEELKVHKEVLCAYSKTLKTIIESNPDLKETQINEPYIKEIIYSFYNPVDTRVMDNKEDSKKPLEDVFSDIISTCDYLRVLSTGFFERIKNDNKCMYNFCNKYLDKTKTHNTFIDKYISIILDKAKLIFYYVEFESRNDTYMKKIIKAIEPSLEPFMNFNNNMLNYLLKYLKKDGDNVNILIFMIIVKNKNLTVSD